MCRRSTWPPPPGACRSTRTMRCARARCELALMPVAISISAEARSTPARCQPVWSSSDSIFVGGGVGGADCRLPLHAQQVFETAEGIFGLGARGFHRNAGETARWPAQLFRGAGPGSRVAARGLAAAGAECRVAVLRSPGRHPGSFQRGDPQQRDTGLARRYRHCVPAIRRSRVARSLTTSECSPWRCTPSSSSMCVPAASIATRRSMPPRGLHQVDAGLQLRCGNRGRVSSRTGSIG